MLEIQLPKEEKNKLHKIQRETKETRIYRKVSILLGLDGGLSIAQLVITLGIDTSTINRYKQHYLRFGLDTYLQDDYKSYWGKLTSHQIALLIKEIRTTIYTTSAQIADWIKSNYGVEYNPQGLIHLLKRIGLVYKKTKLIPGKAHSEFQEEFVVEYDKQQKDLKKDEIIYFCDAVHPQHNTNATYAWILKGCEKEIKSNTGRTRVNINGVLNPNDPTDVLVGDYKTINAETTIEFFKTIEIKNPTKKKIIIYADNAKYYKNKDVEDYLKNSKIKLVFLPQMFRSLSSTTFLLYIYPTYSPNLNLIERLWKFMKKIVINNKYYEKPKEFRNKIFDFFDNIHSYKKELDSLITNNFQIINAK